MADNLVEPILNSLFPQEPLNDTFEPEIDQQELIDNKWLKFSEELTEDKIMKKIGKFATDWESEESKYKSHLKNSYGSYDSQNITTEGTSVKVPEVFALIETEMPHLVNAVFGQTNVIDLKAKFEDPGNERTFKMKSFLNNLIINVCNGEEKTNQIERTALIYGTAMFKVWWNDEDSIDVSGDGSLIPIESAHPDFDLVDPYSFAFDRSNQTQNINNCKWVRERIYKEKEEMLMMRDSGACAWFNESDMISEQSGRNKMNGQNPSAVVAEDDNKTFYDEYSATLFDKDPMTDKYMQKEFIIWELAGNRIIKFVPTPLNRKMYGVVRAYDMPNKFLGKGEPDVIGALSEHASYVWYQLGKTIKRVGQQMALVSMSSGLSPEQMRTIEDGIFPVDDINGLTFQPSMDSKDVEVLNKSFDVIDSKIASVTGVGPALQGESIGDVSATEASYVFQNASNRLEMKLKNIQKGMIKPLAEMMFMLCKQSLTQGTTFYDSNNKPVGIMPQDFVGNYDFIPQGSITQANKALMMSANAQFAQQIIQACGASRATSNPIEPVVPAMLLGLLAPYANESNISKYWQPVPPPPMLPPGMPGASPAGGTPPNADKLENPGLSPEGVSKLPFAANIAPDSLMPTKNNHLGQKTGAALRVNK